MIRSMTGFGRGESFLNGKEFLVEIKTVNHRYCDVFVKLPRQIAFLEDKVREQVSKNLSRGKIEVYISSNDHSDDSKSVLIDEPLANAYINATKLLKDKYNLADDVTVSLISRFPDVLKVEKSEDDQEKIWSLLSVALESALKSLLVMREREGSELRNNLFERLECMENELKNVIARAPEIVKEYKVKLDNRIKELLEKDIVDENRLAMEVAIFADRCSIDEELVRLGSHIIQFKGALDGNQPVGRKLDFLIQEMNREINTIGSKANDLQIVRNVVEIKSELEKIREQIQNTE